MFVSCMLKTDVTAVKIVDRFVFAGIGNFLHIYYTNGDFITKIPVFDGHKIHGIQVEKDDILLYGGCFLQTFNFDPTTVELGKNNEAQETDWILAAQWLRNKHIAVAMMLNQVLILSEDLVPQRTVVCREKSILYSAFISEGENELVIFAGTVFGEVLLWRVLDNVSDSPVLCKLKGHNGVIFSISYNKKSGYISSSSDDRSTILWSIENKSIHEELKLTQPKIILDRKIYGHQSRVFRSILCDDFLITSGEDSVVNVWNFGGHLIRKIEAHQGGPIWCLDYKSGFVISGGSDCGVVMTPVENSSICSCVNLPDNRVPKRVGILKSGNVIVITDSGFLYCLSQSWVKIAEHDNLKSYNLLEMSKCRNLCALVGYNGEIYIYKETGDKICLVSNLQTNRKCRIYSFHWLTCQTWITCEAKQLFLYFSTRNNEIVEIASFVLPEISKDNWTTAACQVGSANIIVGDRRGNIYMYNLGERIPICVLKKVHNHLGVTQLLSIGINKILSLGRDATIKIMDIKSEKISIVSSDVLPFSWLTNFDTTFITGFKGDFFIVYDYKERKIVFKHPCGGGHRSWDFQRNVTTTFAYVKDKSISSIKYREDVFYPKNLIHGYHTDITNSICLIKSLHNQKFILVSGSEDTNLRFFRIGQNTYESLLVLKTHLSSIRSVVLYELLDKRHVLIFSGGGRGQILFWHYNIESNFCRLVYSHYEKSDKMLYESEVRVMSMETVSINQQQCYLFAALSDGNIAIFHVKNDVSFVKNFTYKTKCITKIKFVQICETNVLLVASTDGFLSFYDVTNLDCNLIEKFHMHQSGIVAIAAFSLEMKSKILFLSGGDDGLVALNLFEFTMNSGVKVKLIDSYVSTSIHCAQVTGAWIFSNYFLTSSVDQRVMLFKWGIKENRLRCEFVGKYNTAVADVQGIECTEEMNCVNVFVYGKGVEYLKCRCFE